MHYFLQLHKTEISRLRISSHCMYLRSQFPFPLQKSVSSFSLGHKLKKAKVHISFNAQYLFQCSILKLKKTKQHTFKCCYKNKVRRQEIRNTFYCSAWVSGVMGVNSRFKREVIWVYDTAGIISCSKGDDISNHFGGKSYVLREISLQSPTCISSSYSYMHSN